MENQSKFGNSNERKLEKPSKRMTWVPCPTHFFMTCVHFSLKFGLIKYLHNIHVWHQLVLVELWPHDTTIRASNPPHPTPHSTIWQFDTPPGSEGPVSMWVGVLVRIIKMPEKTQDWSLNERSVKHFLRHKYEVLVKFAHMETYTKSHKVKRITSHRPSGFTGLLVLILLKACKLYTTMKIYT